MRRRRGTISVPVGLERLLFRAATDPALRDELIRDRTGCAERHGLVLAPSERAVLEVAPAAQLAAMIDAIEPSERNLERHRFMRAVAATAVTLAAGTGLGACGDAAQERSAPETDAPFHGRVEKVEVEVPPLEPVGGARPVETVDAPDAGPPRIEIPKPVRSGRGGARPDVDPGQLEAPRVRISEPERNLDGGARPDFEP